MSKKLSEQLKAQREIYSILSALNPDKLEDKIKQISKWIKKIGIWKED